MVGNTIQHYRIRDRLGAGGMGDVYLAEDTRLGREVALKFLAAEAQTDPERRSRFLTEARAASALRSSNIAAIYDIGQHEGADFLVMEYVEGEVLSARIRRGLLPLRDAVDIALQVVDALVEAHARNIVHRDIKSANIIVNARGQVKVLDFGLAKFMRPPKGRASVDAAMTVAEETIAGSVLGTVSYMAPEQALGRPVDQRSDLFSVGVVFYEMLTGRLPFEGQAFGEIVDAILHQPPPALVRLNYAVTPEIEGIVRKALEKNPDLRYQTARDLYNDLQRVRTSIEETERHGSGDPPRKRQRQWQRPDGSGRRAGKLDRGDYVRQHHARAVRRVDRVGHRRDRECRPEERPGPDGDRTRTRVRCPAQPRSGRGAVAGRPVRHRDRPWPGRALDRLGRVSAARPDDPDHRAVRRRRHGRCSSQREDRRRARRDLSRCRIESSSS